MVGLQSKSQKISCVNRLWHKSYCNLPPNYTTWCRNINSIILSKPWFHSLKLSRKIIISFSRLHFGHILLPSHSFKLSLNNSPLCIFPSSSGLWHQPYFVWLPYLILRPFYFIFTPSFLKHHSQYPSNTFFPIHYCHHHYHLFFPWHWATYLIIIYNIPI